MIRLAKKHVAKHVVMTLLMALGLWLAPMPLRAGDLPTAAGSPLAGITFDDRPLLLPVQRNFQMAMLIAGSEMGRTCSRMEAYGWRMAPEEQQRVNQIFNNTIDRMRAQGFAIEAKDSHSVSRDVTLFTADRPDKHLIFMWSAGEIGLVMVLCETSAPLPPARGALNQQLTTSPSEQPLPNVGTPLRNPTVPVQLNRTGKPRFESFTPVGDWVGAYACAQGTTGATLQIHRVKGEHIEGVFRFYPTPKNPYVPSGRYAISGDYDRDSQRILINPGKWLERPKNFFNTVMIGSFDPLSKTFSGFFQGINGCTSFEARYSINSSEIENGYARKAGITSKKPAKPLKAKTKAKAKKVKAEAIAGAGLNMEQLEDLAE
ncbi:MAG: hypothetical protein HGA90_06385, partial [Alphaproteobacteria bacterium]|nr:hypothetical protein [Alphaproteobacteria bacterium]